MSMRTTMGCEHGAEHENIGNKREAIEMNVAIPTNAYMSVKCNIN